MSVGCMVHNRDEKQVAPAPPDRTLPPPYPTFAGRNNGASWAPNTSSPRSVPEGADSGTERYGFTPKTGGETSTGSWFSPTPTSPSDIISIPASSQPPSKRVRRESTPYNGFSSKGGTRGRVDLMGLLNPAPELPVWSPRMPELELEQHVPKPLTVSEVLPQSAAKVTKSQMAIRPQEPRKIEPRPPGYKPFYPPEPIHDNEEEERKRKGRKGPLQSDKRRAQVLQVRGIGACVRCSIFRIACEATEEDQPCKPCLATLPKARKFRVRCTRKWLKDRWDFLLPFFFTEHLDYSKYPDVSPDEDDRRKSFKVTLKPDLGPRVKVLAFGVRGDDIGDSQRWQAHVFRSTESGPQSKQQHDYLVSLPLMPLISDERGSPTEIRDTMTNAASEAVQRPSEWIEAMVGYGSWPQAAMGLVTDFYAVLDGRADADRGSLEGCLRTCFMLFYMGQSFYIPKDKLWSVNERMPSETKMSPAALEFTKTSPDEIVPRYLDRYLKSAMLPDIKSLLAHTFSELERAFRLQDKDKGDEKLSDVARDKIFCMLIVVVVITGITQCIFLRKACAMEKEMPEFGDDYMNEAKMCIKKAEGEVVDHILNLWSYKFPKGAASGRLTASELPVAKEARRIAIIEQFQQSRGRDPGLADIKLDVDFDDPEHFMSHNVERLLLRVDACVGGKLRQTSIESPGVNDTNCNFS